MKIKRAWQRMLSGRRLEILEPSPLDIEIEDIAHGLSFLARWNGQTIGEYPFSVEQHSLLVENIFAKQFPQMDNPSKLFALLHVIIGLIAENRNTNFTYIRYENVGHVTSWNADPDNYVYQLDTFLSGLD